MISTHFRRALRTMVLVCMTAVLTTSCGEDNGTEVPVDPERAAAKVIQANAELERVLYDLLNGDDPDEPDDIDVSMPRRLYHEALELDLSNLDAHFGVAITDLVDLSGNAEVNEAFDEWKEYLENNLPFEAPLQGGKLLGVPVLPSRGADALRLPFDLVAMSAVAPVTALMRNGDVPRLSRVQEILENLVLPLLESASEHLEFVGANASYQFFVTGRMQGDEEADPVEIDQTDILALLAATKLLTAGTRVAVSYEIDLPAYDRASLLAAIQPGSSWLTLRDGGAGHMRQARTDLVDAVNELDRAILSLLHNEPDNQDDDIIKIGPDDLSRADVDSVRNRLPDVLAGLDGGYRIGADWDDDPSTPDHPLLIDLGALFTNPITDWKEMLPGYMGELETRGRDLDYYYAYGIPLEVTIDVPQGGRYDAFFSLVWEESEDPRFYCSVWSAPGSVTWFCQAVETAMTVRMEEILEDYPNTSYAEIYCSHYNTLQAGPQVVSMTSGEYYGVATERIYIPVIVWTASDFNSWVWPDPTFHGILPEMSSTGQVLSIFGMEEGDWSKRFVIDWSGLD